MWPIPPVNWFPVALPLLPAASPWKIAVVSLMRVVIAVTDAVVAVEIFAITKTLLVELAGVMATDNPVMSINEALDVVK